MANPNTLTFALLGFLVERPRSAYELAQQIRTSVVRGIWPSATSHTYAKVKQLVAMGYATAEQKAHGKRSRTVYRVTDSGREALRAWLAEADSKAIEIESERLLKYLFAGNSGIDDADILQQIETEVTGSLRSMLEFLEGFLAHETAIVSAHRKGALVNLMIDFRETYAAWARRQLEGRDGAQPHEDDLDEYRRAQARLRELAGA